MLSVSSASFLKDKTARSKITELKKCIKSTTRSVKLLVKIADMSKKDGKTMR